MGILPSRRAARRPTDGLPSNRPRGVNIEDPYHLRSSGLIRGGGGLPPGARRRSFIWCCWGMLRLATWAGLMALGALLWDSFSQGETRLWKGYEVSQEAPHLAELRVLSTRLRSTAKRPAHSTYACQGRKWEEKEENYYLQNSCRFHDVCLNHSTLQLQYFLPLEAPEEPLFYNHLNGHPHTTFPADFLMTGHIAVQPLVPWAPQVVKGGLPPGAIYHAAPVVVYASLNDFVGQFQHALYDFVMPVFNLLQLFRVYTPDFLLLEAQHQGSDPGAGGLLIKTQDPQRSLLRMISVNPPVTEAELAGAAPEGQGLTCFHTLLAGTGNLQESEARVRSTPFWAAAVASLGVALPPEPPGRSKPNLMVITKTGQRAIENAAALAVDLQARFPGAEVRAFDGNSFAGVPVKQRMELLVGVDVLLTPGGDLAALPALLRPGAVAIVTNYLQATTGANVQSDVDYFWNLDHVTMEYFPVGLEDYTKTTDRPGCQLSEKDPAFEEKGPLANCNVFLTDRETLFHVVGRALRRWGVEHDATPLAPPPPLP